MKSNKKIVGLTGSIATGKSTVTKILRKYGYYVIDADVVAHELMKKGEKNYCNIVNYFGKEILDKNEEIDRKRLANIVFNDKSKLYILNNLTHDNIFHRISVLIDDVDDDVIFLDIALLFENFKKYINDLGIDQIWLVYTDRKKQLERLMERNSLDVYEANKRIDSQIDIEKKVKLSDYIIDNSKDIEFLEKQVLKGLEKL